MKLRGRTQFGGPASLVQKVDAGVGRGFGKVDCGWSRGRGCDGGCLAEGGGKGNVV